jgi:hypothetical protein
MRGFTATSWGAQRLDVFYLNPGLSMVHYACDPTPPAGIPGSSLLTTIAIDQLGGAFTSVPSAVVSSSSRLVVGTMGAVSGPPAGPPLAPGALSTAKPAFDLGQRSSEPPAAAGASEPAAGVARLRVHPPVPEQPRIDVFALDSAYAMRHLELWNGTASSPQPQWVNLGGIFISTPAAIAWDGRVDIFGIGLDRAMYRKTLQNNAWSGEWERLGGAFTSEASAVSWGPRRLDVFARGADFTLRHKSYAGSTVSNWENFGGSLASAPVALSWGADRLDVFALANDGTLAHKWWDGILWNEWEYFGLQDPSKSFVSVPAAASWGPGRIDVFLSGSDGAVYHLWLDADTVGGPESLDSVGTPMPPVFTPAPSAISVAPGRLNLFAPINQVDGYGDSIAPLMGNRTWDGASWRGWDTFGQYGLPSRYRFSVDYFTVKTTRSLNQDTDTAQSTLKVDNSMTHTANQSMGNWGGTAPKQAQVLGLYFDPAPVELCDYAVFNYQIVNSSKSNQDQIDAALNKSGKSLAEYAFGSIEKALGQGLTVITSIEIGTITSIPVIGPILGLLSSWLLGQLGDLFSDGRCDGPVALEQIVISGRDLQIATANGVHTVITDHPGIDSPTGCGDNSDYEVTWSIRRV